MSEPIEDRLKAKAREMGFELAGIARASEADGFGRYQEWLACGYAGEMEYLYRNAGPRRHPESILGDVRSVLMLGMTYGGDRCDQAGEPESPSLAASPTPDGEPGCVSAGSARTGDRRATRKTLPALTQPGSPLAVHSLSASVQPSRSANATRAAGRVAKYAQAPDYHQFTWDKLNALADWLDAEVPGTLSHGVTDTAPLLERDFARRAGLGWIGKNTMLLNKEQGSFFLLSALLTTLELEPDPAFEAAHCGTCTACLDACPTGAFPEPGWLDARKCISYLTIELKTRIPEELRPAVGDWLFGCDICQDVCPWNHRPNGAPGLPHRPDLTEIDPAELLGLGPEELRQRFKGTPLRRAKWRGLLRNAAIVLGNRGDRGALPALRAALKWDDEIVREACAWAIKRIEEPEDKG